MLGNVASVAAVFLVVDIGAILLTSKETNNGIVAILTLGFLISAAALVLSVIASILLLIWSQ